MLQYRLDWMTDDDLDLLTKFAPKWDTMLIDSHHLRKRISLSDPSIWLPLSSFSTKLGWPNGPKSARLLPRGDLDALPLNQIHAMFTANSSRCKSSKVADLGALSSMPNEVFYMILAETDIATLFSLRRLNSDFKRLVESWEPFRTIMGHGQDAVRAMLATGASNMWTAPQLCKVLFTARCELCGKHGEILQLLKCQRCCFKCLATDRRLLAVDQAYATHPDGMAMTTDDLMKIRSLRAVPQPTFWGAPYVRQGNWLFDYTTGLEYSQRRQTKYPVYEKTGTLKSALPTPTILRKRAEASKDRAAYHRNFKLHRNAYLQPPESHPNRLLAAVALPVICQKATAILNTSFDPPVRVAIAPKTLKAKACRGCKYYWNYISPHHHTTHQLYTGPELYKHLKHCKYARIWWSVFYPAPIGDVRVPSYVIDELDAETYVLPRHEGPNSSNNNHHFEVIPSAMMLHFENTANPTRFLYGHQRPTPNAAISGKDWYADSLVEEDAVSQAMWACATTDRTENVFGKEKTRMYARFREVKKLADWRMRRKMDFRRWGFDML